MYLLNIHSFIEALIRLYEIIFYSSSKKVTLDSSIASLEAIALHSHSIKVPLVLTPRPDLYPPLITEPIPTPNLQHQHNPH